MMNRRDVLWTGAAIGGALVAARRAGAHEGHDGHEGHEGHDAHAGTKPAAPAAPAAPPVLTKPPPVPAGWRDDGTVVTPSGRRAPWKLVDGVKVFHLVAQPVTHEIVPGLVVEAWGYSGSTPGPTIEVTEGDRCRFYVTNQLPEATSVHWHGVFLPNGMDGVAGLTQAPIAPGETFVYEFTFGRAGTFMYHPHFDEMIQIALGMEGMIVVHPRQRPPGRVRDYALMLHEWKIRAGTHRPDPMAMSDFNVLTLNSRAYPGTEALVAARGERVRLRLGNLGPMDHHPMHIHGHAFEVVGTDGGAVPASARRPETTVLVPTGTVRVLEFVASANGDWPFHCHMTHHTMNQMGHDVPNLIGVDTSGLDSKLGALAPGYMTMGDTGMGGMGQMGMPGPANSVPMRGADGPFGYIDMGGNFTVLKVRDHVPEDGRVPGWYEHPPGTVAQAATSAQLKKDGIVL
jgi:FtsP/CotA-like multicopper oxidase with cupredoxin domain